MVSSKIELFATNVTVPLLFEKKAVVVVDLVVSFALTVKAPITAIDRANVVGRNGMDRMVIIL